MKYNAVVALGSNVGNCNEYLARAIWHLEQSGEVVVIKKSTVYQNKALTLGQDDYFNAVVLLKTHLTAAQLLNLLHYIESKEKRVRSSKWAARTLDLDLIDYENCVSSRDELHLPHREAFKRNFVLLPLFEIAPGYIFADGSKLKDYVLQRT